MQDAGLGAAMTRLITCLRHDQENNDCINIRDGGREWRGTGITKKESLKMKPDYLRKRVQTESLRAEVSRLRLAWTNRGRRGLHLQVLANNFDLQKPRSKVNFTIPSPTLCFDSSRTAGSLTEDYSAPGPAACDSQSEDGARRGPPGDFLPSAGGEETFQRTSFGSCYPMRPVASAVLSREWPTAGRPIPLHLQYILQGEMERTGVT
jgi:hypothetical protein